VRCTVIYNTPNLLGMISSVFRSTPNASDTENSTSTLLKRCFTCGVFIRGFPPNKKTTRQGKPQERTFRILDRYKGNKFCPKRAIYQFLHASHFVRYILVLLQFLALDEIVLTSQPHIYGREVLKSVVVK
jgi:hypothetical protein